MPIRPWQRLRRRLDSGHEMFGQNWPLILAFVFCSTMRLCDTTVFFPRELHET
jgi:hypothetical protein